jgi:hypothetical protein
MISVVLLEGRIKIILKKLQLPKIPASSLTHDEQHENTGGNNVQEH